MLVNCGARVRVEGSLLRIARLDGEGSIFLDDPDTLINGLRRSGSQIDLFTFVQKVMDTAPKYGYPMEWDNCAVLPVSTFERWWTQQIRFAPRGRVRQAQKRGVVVREVPFDD